MNENNWQDLLRRGISLGGQLLRRKWELYQGPLLPKGHRKWNWRVWTIHCLGNFPLPLFLPKQLIQKEDNELEWQGGYQWQHDLAAPFSVPWCRAARVERSGSPSRQCEIATCFVPPDISSLVSSMLLTLAERTAILGLKLAWSTAEGAGVS